MKTIINVLLAVALACMMQGCDNFEYHPYASNIHGNIDVNRQNIARISSTVKSLPMKFVFLTDTQTSYDELDEAIGVIKRRGDIDFIIHGGDQTDFGLPKEFMWCRDLLEKSGIPFFAVIGNHDCLGNGDYTFEYVYGAKNYSFNVAGVHFLCLNTNALEYDYSEPVPDLDFIENDAAEVASLNASQPGSVTHTVVVMHACPYDEQFNNNVAKPFRNYLRYFPGISDGDETLEVSAGVPEKTFKSYKRGFCINGHNHRLSINNIYNDDLLFYQCPNMAKRCFFVFEIDADGYEMEVVEY